MAYDGSGNFVRVHNWQDDATAGIKILSSRHDEEDNGFATGLSNAICRDGQSPILADIPFSGKKITNLGNPINPQDSATKNYVDTLSGWPTSKNISGADLNGRLNFTALGGVNGVTWSNADMSWFGKAATANQASNRLVVNSSIDGTSVQPGTDLVSIDDTGHVNLSSGILTYNLSYDGTNWRTPVAGYGLQPQLNQSSVSLKGIDTATTTTYQTVTPRQYALLQNTQGSTVFHLYKSATGKYTYLQSYTGTSARWQIIMGDATAESGSNAGSDFSIGRFNDAGTYVGAPISISRSSGAVTIGQLSLGTNALTATGVGGFTAFAGICQNAVNYGYVGFNSAGVNYSFYGNGNAFNTVAWTISDGRMKSDIAACDPADALAKVKAITVCSYRKQGAIKRDGIADEIGWLAQDIETVIPEAVYDHAIPESDEAMRTLIGSDTVKATNDRTMLATLWAAVQHQASIIEALQARLAALEAGS